MKFIDLIKKRILLLDLKKHTMVASICVAICVAFGEIKSYLVAASRLSSTAEVIFCVLEILLFIVSHIELHVLHREAKFSGRHTWVKNLIVYRLCFAAITVLHFIALITGSPEVFL